MQTNRVRMLRLTAGAVTLAIALTSCQSRQDAATLNTASGKAELAAAPAKVLVEQAAAAQAAGNTVAAISFAELAVTADAQDAEARSALAKAYFAAGRYQSAADAYGDLIAMNPEDTNAAFKVALAELAGGDRSAALAKLDRLAAQPGQVADVGLALALAGEADRAAAMLEKAVRGGDTTPRVRQNLALAQALSGKWAAARTTASVDLTPDVVDARVAEWAALASNKDATWRVQTMLGVAKTESDAGRPTELAWAPPVVAPMQFAAAAAAVPVAVIAAPEPAPQPAPVVAAKSEPLVRAAPVKIASVSVPAVSEPKPLVFNGKTAPRAEKPAQVVKVKAVRPVGLTPKAIVAVKREIRPLPKPSSGAWVVQLGAYAKPEFLSVGWRGLVDKEKALSEYKPLKSSIEVGGSKYYRLSVGTFAALGDAVDLCKSLKAEGHRCFVRKGDATLTATPKGESKRT